MPHSNPAGSEELLLVETLLLSDDRVKQAKLMTVVNGASDTQLLAVISIQSSSGSDADQSDGQVAGSIRKKLLNNVRPAVVPKRWVVLEDLPTTEAGEIDEGKISDYIRDVVKGNAAE